MRGVSSAIVCVFALGLNALLLTPAAADSPATSSKSVSLLEKVIPSLPKGFSSHLNDPWGHKMGNQTATEFAIYYDPALVSPTELQAGGFLDAYSVFASGMKHTKSNYITISLVEIDG